MKISVGSLVMYMDRYVGQRFVVVETREVTRSREQKNVLGKTDCQKVRCVSMDTGKKTRWCSTSRLSVLA